MYDLIGDIHGYATPLKQLLTKMGYKEQADGPEQPDVWQHPDRKVIFLGDFVDRGPEQLEVVQIAKSMVEGGHALAVMGNHEFNAVAWATETETKHPNDSKSYLRAHSDEKRKQHQAFLDQVTEGSETHKDLLKWFRTLPLFLELDGLRVVHACWHPEQIDVLGPFLNDENVIKPDAWPQLALKDGAGYEALEIVLKGLEIPLPKGYSFLDSYGKERTDIRTAWWNLEATTYREVAMVPGSEITKIPDTAFKDVKMPSYVTDKPVFIGHYWLQGEPEPLHPFVACLDYSVAGKKRGKLCAYRWQGETTLSADNYYWVDRAD